MSNKATDRLRALARQGGISVNTESSKEAKLETRISLVEANVPHGERGDFLKVTITLSPEIYQMLTNEARRRKLAREPNAQVSAILREAAVAFLAGRSDQNA